MLVKNIGNVRRACVRDIRREKTVLVAFFEFFDADPDSPATPSGLCTFSEEIVRFNIIVIEIWGLLVWDDRRRAVRNFRLEEKK